MGGPCVYIVELDSQSPCSEYGDTSLAEKLSFVLTAAEEQDSVHASELILMGTGTSVGVPVVGCGCPVCTSTNPRNKRTRSGVLVKAPLGEFVIDTGPELRLQLLWNHATLIRAALFTHAHADHIMGLDDLRICSFQLEERAIQTARTLAEQSGDVFDEEAFLKAHPVRLPLFCEEVVESSLRQTFQYAFDDGLELSHRFAIPRLEFQRIAPGVSQDVLGLNVLPIRLMHGKLPVLGFRIGDVAFCTDVSSIPAESRPLLEGLDTLILDALRYEPHPTHMHVDLAVKWAERLAPRRTILTHMSHELDYQTLLQELPMGVEPGYDGLSVPLQTTIDVIGYTPELE